MNLDLPLPITRTSSLVPIPLIHTNFRILIENPLYFDEKQTSKYKRNPIKKAIHHPEIFSKKCAHFNSIECKYQAINYEEILKKGDYNSLLLFAKHTKNVESYYFEFKTQITKKELSIFTKCLLGSSLTSLRSLSLSFDEIKDSGETLMKQVFNKLGNLSNLRRLSLELKVDENLRPRELKILSKRLKNLKYLEEFDFKLGKPYGILKDYLVKLSALISTISWIKKLSLRLKEIKDTKNDGVILLFNSIGNLDNLEALKLEFPLTGCFNNCYEVMGIEIGKLKSLKSLIIDLRCDCKHENNLVELSKHFSNLVNLEKFHFYFCFDLKVYPFNKTIEEFERNFQNFPRIKEFSFHFIIYTIQFDNLAANLISNMKTLKSLNLEITQSMSNNESLQSFCEKLGELEHLEHFKLNQDFYIGSNGQNIIPYLMKSLEKLKKLKTLIFNVKISSDIESSLVQSFCQTIADIKSLEKFGFQAFSQGTILISFEMLSLLPKLKSLHFKLGYNMTSDESILNLASIIGSLSNLEELSLDITMEKEISSKSLIVLIRRIGKMEKITMLDFKIFSYRPLGSEYMDELKNLRMNMRIREMKFQPDFLSRGVLQKFEVQNIKMNAENYERNLF